MGAISGFFTQNIGYVYFFYGLAFFSMGLGVLLESGRSTEFRFGRALLPLALFGLVHGAHEWFEMFQIFAAQEVGRQSSVPEELLRVVWLAVSFLLLLDFGLRLLPGAEARPQAHSFQLAAMSALWLGATALLLVRLAPSPRELLISADVLARYSLAIPGALLAAWALLRERRDFHARGMSQYGRGLLWAALAFFVYGAVGQLFSRPSLVFPSQTINSVLFLRIFGVPVQLLRGLAAVAIAVTLAGALRAFEMESRLRLVRANDARIAAQSAALDAQARRANDVEALNARLRVTARELSAMVEMSRILNSNVTLKPILRDALYQIVWSIEGSCYSAVFLQDAADQLQFVSSYLRPGGPLPAGAQVIEDTAAQASATAGPVGAGPDVPPLSLPGQEAPMGATYQVLALPLSAQGRAFGALVLSASREGTLLGANELRLLTAFAQQLVAAVENNRLYQVLREREAQLQRLVRELVNAQEGERQRIARELHDETGQKLTALAMGLAAIETRLAGWRGEHGRNVSALVHNLREVADQAIRELRNIMSNLRPSQLDDLGLSAALRWYVQQYQQREPDLEVRLDTSRFQRRLPTEQETVLFRVAQEALTNVARHAQSRHVSVELAQQLDTAVLTVSDDGIGFDPLARVEHDEGGGWGLVDIRERVTLAGGRCTVTSARGRGTQVKVELPLESTDDATPGSPEDADRTPETEPVQR